jgi:hypothetical protein
MNKLFEWAVPRWLRSRPVMEDNALITRLAAIEDSDPVLRALMEVLAEQFAIEASALMRNDLGTQLAKGQTGKGEVSVMVTQQSGSAAMEYQRGRAASLYSLMDRIEAEREGARKLVEERRKGGKK